MTARTEEVDIRPPLNEKRLNAVWGIQWAFLAFVIDKIATFATVAILARLLSPADFALIASALLFVTIADAFREIGLREALIWNPEQGEPAADTAFWFNVALSSVLTLALLVLAPIVSAAVDTPGITPMVAVLAVGLFVSGLGATHEALQEKVLQFGHRYAVDLAASLSKAVASVGLALLGFGVISVAVGILVAAVVRTVGRWATFRWIPKLRAVGSSARGLLIYARHILTTRIADAIIERADQIAILTLLSSVQLGYYYIAARIPELVVGSINIVAGRVMFPSYVAISGDRAVLSAHFLTASRLTAYVAMPVAIGLALVSDLAIEVVFGPQWSPSWPALAILSLCSMVYSILWSAGDIMKAVGKPQYLARITLIQLATIFPILFGLSAVFRSIEAVATGMLISFLVDVLIKLVVVRRILKFEARQFFEALHGATMAAAVMTAAVLLARGGVDDLSPSLQLLASVLVGGISYCSILWWLEQRQIRGMLRVIRGETLAAAGTAEPT